MAHPWKHPKTGIYHFRRAVPADLRLVVGKWEEKRSLRTKDARDAKGLFTQILAEVEAEWSRLRSNPSGPASEKRQKRSLSEPEAHERSAWLYRHWLHCHAADPGKQTFWDTDGFQHLWADHRLDFLTFPTLPQASGNVVRIAEMQSWCLKHVDQLSEVHDWELDEDSRLRLAKAMAAATQRASLTLQKVARGELDPAVLAEAISEPRAATSTDGMTPPNCSTIREAAPVTLDAVLQGWWMEAKAGGRKISTYESYRNTFKGLAAFLKRDDARSVTAEDGRVSGSVPGWPARG